MNDLVTHRYGIDPYLDWVEKEGLPVAEDYGIDLFKVEMRHWDRVGVKGAAVHLKGRGDFCNMFLMELPPGGSTTPQRHLYEDVYYVLEGSGSTQIELADGSKRSFEWGPKSLFAIPLNAKHRHFNSSGRERALLVTTTDLPMVMNTFHNEKFIFDNTFDFDERTGKGKHFTGTMHAHISEMPVGTYKKGHRHGPGFHVMCVVGHGYSLLWFDKEKDFLRIDWKHGVVFPPADQQFHQHFNASSVPARYLATGVGGLRYPLTTQNRRSLIGLKPGENGAVSTSIKEGGDQVEYEDQDARIQQIWLEETRKHGVDQKMDKFFPAKA